MGQNPSGGLLRRGRDPTRCLRQPLPTDAEHGQPQGVAHFGPGAGGNHQRHHAEDEGKRRPRDRRQEQPRRLQRRLPGRLALLPLLLGELHDEDGLLAGEAHQGRKRTVLPGSVLIVR
jgi:hypothetical protein